MRVALVPSEDPLRFRNFVAGSQGGRQRNLHLEGRRALLNAVAGRKKKQRVLLGIDKKKKEVLEDYGD